MHFPPSRCLTGQWSEACDYYCEAITQLFQALGVQVNYVCQSEDWRTLDLMVSSPLDMWLGLRGMPMGGHPLLVIFLFLSLDGSEVWPISIVQVCQACSMVLELLCNNISISITLLLRFIVIAFLVSSEDVASLSYETRLAFNACSPQLGLAFHWLSTLWFLFCGSHSLQFGVVDHNATIFVILRLVPSQSFKSGWIQFNRYSLRETGEY